MHQAHCTLLSWFEFNVNLILASNSAPASVRRQLAPSCFAFCCFLRLGLSTCGEKMMRETISGPTPPCERGALPACGIRGPRGEFSSTPARRAPAWPWQLSPRPAGQGAGCRVPSSGTRLRHRLPRHTGERRPRCPWPHGPGTRGAGGFPVKPSRSNAQHHRWHSRTTDLPTCCASGEHLEIVLLSLFGIFKWKHFFCCLNTF